MSIKVVGIGEVLWDLLPSGKQMGGAPANFAYHAWSLGADSLAISRVGNDALGRELLDHMRSIGLRVDGIEVDQEAPTSTVSVSVDEAGQPRFTIHEHVAWDRLEATRNALNAVSSADVLCFGSLAQRTEKSRTAIHSLVRASPEDSLRIFDINLRQHFYSRELVGQSLEQANVLKVNDAEWPVLAGMFELKGTLREQIEALAHSRRLRVVALTRGGEGSLLFADGTWSDHSGVKTKVADTVGAGDSFTAAMALGLLAGWNLDLINQRANEVAAFVASCPGATPTLKENLRAPFKTMLG